MDHKLLNHTIATCVRVEHDTETDRIFLVFEVVDEVFRRAVKDDWMQDIDLKLIGRNLVKDG